ncbi:MAG: YifB family Mg chelatase-like AAA ATPase [Phycisphaeraceae bacterium]|nr:MAG: YifB family Mg chelatase-like AAA ATPase [Phycisphaeraceae bacterium]
MIARVESCLLQGIDARPCEIEIDVDDRGLDKQTIVGLPDAAVKESLERVRAALANAGYPFPAGRSLINLAPADVRKEGPVYDLPIALGMLLAQGVVRSRAEGDGLDPRRCLVVGELALDGRVRPVKGAIAMAAMARERRLAALICPKDNAAEAAVVGGVDVFGVRTLSEVIGLLSGEIDAEPEPRPDVEALLRSAEAPIDFAEVRGQEGVKRAIVVAAAGSHNLLMLGPAGTGKTMMAKALPGVLPPLTADEAIEITRIYSAAGAMPHGDCLITTRPVRTPHHTASPPAIVGGGVIPRAGEISLAHRGVLFLDELPEFGRGVLETLRQPMEDHVVTIARAHGSVCFPASFMLVAAMNPTPRGDVAPGEVGRREMEQYIGRLSGPLLDRVDIHVEAPAVPFKQLSDAPRGTDSKTMREQVAAARQRMAERQGPGVPNARLSGKQLDSLARMSEGAMALLGQAIAGLGLSARAYDKIRRVSRTIADLDGQESITEAHVAEAVQYRLLDRRV